LRLETRPGQSEPLTTINPVPIYEFSCESCDHRFEELVGSHVGLEAADVVCPECGSAKVERQLSTSYAPLQNQMTPNQRRRLEDKRGTNRGGAKDRFKQQRAAERRAAAKRSGGAS
jgi:putative FmdB family regulatory protein